MKNAAFFVIASWFVLLLLLTPSGVKGQQGVQLGSPATTGFASQPNFGVQIGTSFSTGFSGGMQSTQFVAPNLQWSISPRLHIIAGGIFATGQFSGVSSFSPMGLNQDMTPIPSQPFAATAYAAGAYQVNDRLTILGAGWMERSNMQHFGMQMNPQAINPMNRGMMVGFNYRITDNLHFGAQVSTQSGFSPFQRMHHHGGFNPWGNNAMPFGSPWGW